MSRHLYVLSSSHSYPYEQAMLVMDRLVMHVRNANINMGCVWLLEHEPVITVAQRTLHEEMPVSSSVPVVKTNRGGKATYHGYGQRIAYCIVPLAWFDNSPRNYVTALEEWVIQTMGALGVQGVRDERGVGVWIDIDSRRCKMAAVGVRVSRGVASHGVAINIHNDLPVYETFVPCGIHNAGVTNLQQCAPHVTFTVWDEVFVAKAANIFAASVEVLQQEPDIFFAQNPTSGAGRSESELAGESAQVSLE